MGHVHCQADDCLPSILQSASFAIAEYVLLWQHGTDIADRHKALLIVMNLLNMLYSSILGGIAVSWSQALSSLDQH